MNKKITTILLLKTDEIEKNQQSLAKEFDMQNSLASFASMEKFLHALGSKYLKNLFAKEYKEDYGFFNISHSREFVCMAISQDKIGVDIEKNSRFEYENGKLKLALAKRITSNDELFYITTSKDLSLVWTLKESLLKCLGVGIDRELKQVPAFPLGLKMYEGQPFFTKSFHLGGYYLSLAIQTSSPCAIKIENVKIK